jgi:hypothetical protein
MRVVRAARDDGLVRVNEWKVLKRKIRPGRVKRSRTVSAVRQATLRLSLRASFLEKHEKWRTPSYFDQC